MKRPFVIFTFQIKETRVYSDGEKHDYEYMLPIIATSEKQKDAAAEYVSYEYPAVTISDYATTYVKVRLVNTRINDNKLHDWYADEIREKGFAELHSSMIATY